MVAGTTANADTGPTDINKDNNKEQLQDQQAEKNESGSEAIKEDLIRDQEGASDEDDVSISNSSFNYLFYLIYKIKFADIFKLTNRNTKDNSLSIPTININALLEKITNPKI
jgi:hypothetical protein